MLKVRTKRAARHEVFILVALDLEQNSPIFYVHHANARVICCNHDAIGHLCVAEELYSSHLLSFGELTCSIAALNLLQML